MERRKFVIGMGSLAAGGAAAMGSGAFSSVEADRDVEIEVADDADAFLAIKEGEGADKEYFGTDGGVAYLDFTETDIGGEGLNQDASTIMRDVFEIHNQGTQKVYVWFEGFPEGLSMGTDSNPDGDDTNLTLGDQDGEPVDHPEPEKLALDPGEAHEEGWVWFSRDFDYDEWTEADTLEVTLHAKTADEA